MNKVLIVVDMQNDFVSGSLGSKEACAVVPNIKKKILEVEKETGFANNVVIYTRDTHFGNYMNTMEGVHLPVPHCIKGTDGWKLHETVQKALDKKAYKIIEKPTFGSVELPKYIDETYDATDLSLTLVGLCTDICVVSNALLLKAHFPEVDIKVDASCCAGVTPESHMAALNTMKMCQIDVVGEE